MSTNGSQPDPLVVELPAGGELPLQTLHEVDQYEKLRDRYIEDYGFSKANDLFLLGMILQQQIIAYRAQQRIAGLEPEYDASERPTGHYTRVELKPKDAEDAIRQLNKATEQIQKLEESLGVDKKTREAGGQHTVASYVDQLKRAGHEYGVHIAKRVILIEGFIKELTWRSRLTLHGDAEDRAYHDLTPENVLQWVEDQIKAIEAHDQKYAQEKGKLWVGKL